MAFSIALTLAQRDNLLTLQSIERNQSTTQRRLSSGREVNDVTDDVFRYFAARALDERATEFLEYKGIIDQGISALKTAVDTIDSLSSLFDQLRGVIQGAAGKDTVSLNRLGQTLTPTLQEVGNILVDANYQSINLLQGDGNGNSINSALTVRFSEKFTLEIASHDIFQVTTDITKGSVLYGTDYQTGSRFVSYATGNVPKVTLPSLLRHGSNAADIIAGLSASSGRASILQPIVENIRGVIRNLNIRAQELGTYIGLLQVRSDFSRVYATEHNKGTDKYTLADANQEGAYLVALQTRQQLSLSSLAVSGRQQNAILTLFN